MSCFNRTQYILRQIKAVKQLQLVSVQLSGAPRQQQDICSTALYSCCLQHRADLHKQLITTVEEDATNRDHFTALADRREKAAALKLQLEHKLKTQRMEQAKQIGVLQVCCLEQLLLFASAAGSCLSGASVSRHSLALRVLMGLGFPIACTTTL